MRLAAVDGNLDACSQVPVYGFAQAATISEVSTPSEFIGSGRSQSPRNISMAFRWQFVFSELLF